ncbi:MAG TPA: glycosyltransferase family 87 protein, partial [Candidatus Acidoferrales bacterium]|nr:glycosyltransferase family 87 protein [Candidatus Acidoferrales bacterium]
MAGNVYGLRLLGDPVVRRVGAAVVAVLAVLYRLIQVPATPADHVGYDFRFYWTAARQLLDGGSIYSAQQLAGPYPPQGQEGFLYPPPLAALVTPVAALFPSDPLPGLWIWSGLAALVLAVTVLALARTEDLGGRFPLLRGRWAWVLVGAAFALPPVVDELVNGNVHLFIAGLMAAAWIGLRRHDAAGDRAAGIALGIATVVKLFPVLLLLWLVLRGRWRPVGWAVAGALGLAVLTLPVTGVQPWLDYPTVLANMAAPIDVSASLSPTVWLAPLLGFGLARVVVTAAVLAVLLWVSRRADERVGYAAAIVLALLATPALWTHYLSILVVPMLLALAGGVPAAIVGLAYVLLSAGYQA